MSNERKMKYGEIMNIVLERFPEFRETDEYKSDVLDPDTTYYGFARFIDYVLYIIKNDLTARQNEAKRFFGFLNECLEFGDERLINLIQVEVFERFVTYKDLHTLLVKNLSNSSMKVYVEFMKNPAVEPALIEEQDRARSPY